MNSFILNHCIAFAILSLMSVVCLRFSEQVQRVTLRIFDFQSVPIGDYRRKVVEDESYLFKIHMAGLLFLAGDLVVVLLIFKNDF